MSASALLGILLAPIRSRLEQEVEEQSIRLSVLEARLKGFNPRLLAKSETFASAFQHHLVIAMRTHEEEKLEALRNAATNVAIERVPSEDLQAVFRNYIDFLTAWHLRILRFLAGPQTFAARAGRTLPQLAMGAPEDMLEAVFPELGDRRDVQRQMVRDLHQRGLISVESLGSAMSESGMKAKRTTDLGDEFLRFIERPSELDEGDQ